MGIPAGGLFTGAEGVKTERQAAIYGGTAGVAYDPNYHGAGDELSNVNSTALDQMSDAAAHAVFTYAMQKPERTGGAKAVSADRLTYKGPDVQR